MGSNAAMAPPKVLTSHMYHLGMGKKIDELIEATINVGVEDSPRSGLTVEDGKYTIKRLIDAELSSDLFSVWFGNSSKRSSSKRRFVEWAQNEIAVVLDFHKRILFSNEAHFWLNGYVNNQNCRIWSEANPQVYVERPLLPEKLTVWCALWAGGILLQKR
ncbi:transposable element Tc3 transposase [Trichonephila clavipes]|nr:transposable element Tc3 transposase [Trichonephila clavipes]